MVGWKLVLFVVTAHEMRSKISFPCVHLDRGKPRGVRSLLSLKGATPRTPKFLGVETNSEA